MTFGKGDFIKIEYNLWRIADEKLVRTTDKKLAQDNDIFSESARYEPQLIVIEKDSALKALWDAVKAMDVGQSKKIELEPKDAFGERNTDLVRVMPIADFRKKDIEPEPGMQIDIEGVIATVKSVNSGRVMVDANNPLAGEKIRYEIKVVGKVTKDDEKIRSVALSYGLVPEKTEVREGIATLVFGPETKINAGYFVNKSYTIAAILEYMDAVKKVIVQEEYSRPEKKD